MTHEENLDEKIEKDTIENDILRTLFQHSKYPNVLRKAKELQNKNKKTARKPCCF